jgi:dihydrofolate reductase
MKLILAQSYDEFLAKSSNDKMLWTGVYDKHIFKLLTHFDNGPLLVGSTTAVLLPSLKHREVIILNRKNFDLTSAAIKYPNGILIGGPTIALEALKRQYIKKFVLVTIKKSLVFGISSKELLEEARKYMKSIFSFSEPEAFVTFMSLSFIKNSVLNKGKMELFQKMNYYHFVLNFFLKNYKNLIKLLAKMILQRQQMLLSILFM